MPKALRRSIIVAAAGVLAVTTVTGVAPAQPSGGPGAALAPSTPPLRLAHATDSVTLERHGDKVRLDLGVYAIAGDEDFRIDAHRTSWWKPIRAEIVRPSGNVALPQGSFPTFQRMKQFFTVKLTKRSTGEVVNKRRYSVCPAAENVHIDPESPIPATAYPDFCPYSAYTRGAVYGISAGHGISLFGYGRRAELPLGHYLATVTVNPVYADPIGMSKQDRTTEVKVNVVKGDGDECRTGATARGCKLGGSTKLGTPVRTTGAGDQRVPVHPGARPNRETVAPTAAGVYPDLQSLPAYAISLGKKGTFLSFAATVWNAGPSPLVIDGFRRQQEDLMDAYQYYYDANGNPVGHEPAGTMEWDDRHGHTHWHFRDFARYRLLDANKQGIVRSRKEAFCLANTDAVDYSVDGANWNPYNTDLHTSCGDYTAIAVREVLDAGNGDTYFQSLPGQSFNIKNLPNGTYYVAVEANPFGVMHETRSDNNDSYRKIYLRGTPKHRRVIVPQLGQIHEDGGFF